MTAFERVVVNSPVVTALHRRVALPRVLRLARNPLEGPVLEVGCGQGITTEGLLDHLPHHAILAIDFDAAQVRRARQRLAGRAKVMQGDATRLQFGDNQFGCVAEFNMMHHVAQWRQALREVHRVLKPGGQFIFRDYTAKFARTPLGLLFPHESRFTCQDFKAALEEVGFKSVFCQGYFVLYGVAVKASQAPANVVLSAEKTRPPRVSAMVLPRRIGAASQVTPR